MLTIYNSMCNYGSKVNSTHMQLNTGCIALEVIHLAKFFQAENVVVCVKKSMWDISAQSGGDSRLH